MNITLIKDNPPTLAKDLRPNQVFKLVNGGTHHWLFVKRGSLVVSSFGDNKDYICICLEDGLMASIDGDTPCVVLGTLQVTK